LAWNDKLKGRRHLTLFVTSILIVGVLTMNLLQSHQKAAEERDRSSADLTREAAAKLDGERLRDAVTEVGRMTKLNTDLQNRLLATSAKIASMSSHTYDQLTGGNTYPEVTPIFFGTSKGYALFMTGVGSAPIVDARYSLALGEPPISLSQEELKKMTEDNLTGAMASTEKSLGTIPWRTGRILQDYIFPTIGGPNIYRIGIRATNGQYLERLEVRFAPNVPGGWQYRDEIRRDIGISKYGTVILKKMSSWQP
jgi:hypothetical protein